MDGTGALTCWGANKDGRAAPPTTAMVDFCVGGTFGCGLTAASGSVQCWGYDGYGQVSEAPSGAGYVELSCGLSTVCAINSSREVECWGSSGSGQTEGTEHLADEVSVADFHACAIVEVGGAKEVRCWGAGDGVKDSSSELTSMTSGYDFNCGVGVWGDVQCWAGANSYGQTTTPSTSLGPWTQVSAGVWHACALRKTGEIDCWGQDTYGQASP